MPTRRAFHAGLAAMLVAPGLPASAGPSHPARAYLGVRRGGRIEAARRFVVPDAHQVGDGLIAFEGVGWESDRVAYRIYLDERLSVDVFGKRRPEPVLHRIAAGGDYHRMSDWGMDVLAVGRSCGVGGPGVFRDGGVQPVGRAQLEASVEADGPALAAVRMDARGWSYPGGLADLVARFSIARGSRLTHVAARLTGGAPFGTGIVKHPGARLFSSLGGRGRWTYLATLGRQSLNDDDLGQALFYTPGGRRDGRRRAQPLSGLPQR